MSERSTTTPRIWTVSELNRSVGELLEGEYPRVRVEGEISNWKVYSSGHAYFSLKDAGGQIAAAWFGIGQRGLRFDPKDGLAVVAAGKVSLYGPRGTYQLIVREMEPKGKGALQLAFEQLKEKLQAEGLFDAARKRPLPRLPRTIGIVTSPTGAAIRDMLTVLGRRYANLRIVIDPVRVQGEGAAAEIAAAISALNRLGGVDVIIVGRGGGSIEDLWAFNEEIVARAIAGSAVPVISAVGHETDFTIADFVADLRAPTPSAAAELVVQSKDELEERVANLARRLRTSLGRRAREARHRLDALAVRRMVADGRRRLRDLAQRVDGLDEDARAAVAAVVERRRERALRAAGKLDALSPLGVLGRGYAICRRLPGLEVVRDASAVAAGAEVRVLLHRGELQCTVTGHPSPSPGERG